jgi:hypothetical protein
MFPKPRQDLVPNTAEFERLPFVRATGFREYDARWRYPEEINLLGLEAVGLGLATLMRERGVLVGRTGRLENTLKIRPPLIFGEEHIGMLVEALDAGLSIVEGAPAGAA